MPPRTRGVKLLKACKENVDISTKNTVKIAQKSTKPGRKPLADKTNSASDENATPEPIKKVVKASKKASQKVVPTVVDEDRPRRNRRLPTRYIENQILNNLSNSKEITTTPSKPSSKTPVKNTSKVESPLKSSHDVLENSLVLNRERRVCRLPSKFDDSVSPSKFAPIKPCHTSTPLVLNQKRQGKIVKKSQNNNNNLHLKTTLVAKVSPPKVSPVKNSLKQITLQKTTPEKPAGRKLKNPINNNLHLKTTHSKKVSPLKVSPVKNPSKQIALLETTPDKPAGRKLKNLINNNNNNLHSKATHSKKVSPLKVSPVKNPPKQITPQKTAPEKPAGRKLVQKKINEVVNTNVRQDRTKRLRKVVEYKEVTLSPKPNSPVKSKPKSNTAKIISLANSSFRVLEDKKSKKGDDVYEFTFDPSEEPEKKKRKKVINKKPSKPKQRVYKNNYEKNLAKALADLKNVVSKQKQGDAETAANIVQSTPTVTNNKPIQSSVATAGSKPVLAPPTSVVISTTADIHHNSVTNNYSARSNLSNKNHRSIRVEDIAVDFEETIDKHDDINYSPVNSPAQNQVESSAKNVCPVRQTAMSDDPLNLRNDVSFFEDQPVASSSMNISNRDPNATPWRVEFERLPIKWQANTYVKPNMTPALDSSYINNFDDSKKKHVYTNMVEQVDQTVPDIVEEEAPKLKQTSIISFIKEVVERSAHKKRKMGSGTPTKAQDVTNTSGASNNNASSENDASGEGKKTQKRKHDVDINPTPVKVARKDNENTLFGFDDSENQEQENISPVKVANPQRLRNLRSRSNAVLKEMNKQTGPMRAELPAAMKSKLAPSSDVVEKIYDQMKSAADAPVLLDKQGIENTETEMPKDVQDEDSNSVHLFEDVELIHHLKPTRKSYGKSKKVAFDQQTSDSGDEAPARNVSSDDDADDLSFHLPEFKTRKATKKKKNTKKQLLSKKEKAEVDAWAACFNSMCEDIEEFDLVVE